MVFQENTRRKALLFGSHSQLTGEGMEGIRQEVRIPDHSIPVQYLTREVLDTPLYKRVVQAGSIHAFLEICEQADRPEAVEEVRHALIVVRCMHDPSYAFAIAFKIKDKITGEMVPFNLNYAQRKLLAEFEELRREGRPIKLILLKARQWGGSTLTQLYMAWIQLFLKEGWNSLIVAQTKDTARRIKAMYSKVLQFFPDNVIADGPMKFSPSERSSADSIITDIHGKPLRRNVITVSSFENYESTRGSDIAMVHYSEVAYWITTPQKSAMSLIRAVTSGMAEGVPLTLEVMESTANGKSGFFHDEYQEAKHGRSSRKALFIPFFYIENDMMEFRDEEEERAFAEWLYQNKDSDVTTEKTAESGKYLWSLWEKGATLQHIKWYVERRKSFHSHAQMASEAPSDDMECFTFSGQMLLSPQLIADREEADKKMPVWRGDVDRRGDSMVMNEAEFGPMKIWEHPQYGYNFRYLVVVDVGGRKGESDYSVITVIDRINVTHPDMPLFNSCGDGNANEPGMKVVARWRGHLRYDLMAWKAVEIARYYDEALLVFESNTFDRKKAEASEFVETGDHILGILNTISNDYDNLYMRTSSDDEDVRERTVSKLGFQTNRKTKQQMVDLFVVDFEDGRFHDPDEEFYKELYIYEQRPDGSYGNIPGAHNHDDIVMTDMIACVVNKEMLPPEKAADNFHSQPYHPRRTFNESMF